ncbi:CoA pyrophosphatase [uncultured Sphingomonas sp.]|uniref:CoA pyrophosphatase n=1 Tax=uncultured Sphingomonas sp. TaxID=158754 RepID=UPI0035CA2BF3
MTLADRLRVALAEDHAPVLLPGDLPGLPDDGAPPAPAAVLVAITDRDDPGVILTRRTETMRRHAGQIAFPGGRIDTEDENATAAALREAEEEIGLPPAAVTVIGPADHYLTGTGYGVTPIVGVIPPDLTFRPSTAEVAAVFEVPLAFLLDPGNVGEASVQWEGRARRYYEITWRDRRIWGATAAMIVNLSRRLRWTG